MPAALWTASNKSYVLWASTVCTATLLLARSSQHDWIDGDTRSVVAGLPAISRCLGAGRLVDCNRLAGLPGGGVSKYPLIQTVPGYLLHEAGLSPASVVGGLITINSIAVVGFAVALARWAHRRSGTPLAVIATLLLLAGMLVAYAAQSFGEGLAAVAFGAVALAGMRTDRVSPYLLPAAATATITKEVAAPLVACFAAAAILIGAARLEVARPAFVRAAMGIGIGLLANATFNEFRYGSLINRPYLDEGYAPRHAVPVNAAGLLVAPNGGIIWFWPGAVAAALVLAVAAVRRSESTSSRIGALVGLIGAGGAVVSGAAWWDPFGWYSWGPRLLVPAATATVALAVGVLSRQDIRRTWLSTTGLVAIGLVSFAVLLPTVGSVFTAGGSQIDNFRATWVSRPDCDTRTRLPTQLQQSCTTTEAWEMSSTPLANAIPTARSFTEHGDVLVLAYWIAMASTGITVTVWLKRAHELRPAKFAIPAVAAIPYDLLS